jgi:hypothetical protein
MVQEPESGTRHREQQTARATHFGAAVSCSTKVDIVMMMLTIASMFYHMVIVHLFRPMLKVDLIHSDTHPRDICTEAANKVSEIVRIYRQLYDFRVAHLAIPHILLSACIVHLLYSKDDKVSYNNLVEGLQGLEDLHECHYFGARSFRILHTLARTWNLPWPEELRNSKLVSKADLDNPYGTTSLLADPLLVVPNTVTTTGTRMGQKVPYSPIDHGNRRESLSMFSNQTLQLASHPATARPGSVPATQHQSPAIGHTPTHSYNPIPSYSQYSQSISVSPNAAATVSSPTIETAEILFWNPIPGMPGPILPRNSCQQISPMGLDTVLQSSDMGDRLVRDGFKMSEDWQSNHVNGFTTSSDAGFNLQNAQAGNFRPYAQPGEGVGYQQQQQQQQHGGHTQQQGYDPRWYPNQMS